MKCSYIIHATIFIWFIDGFLSTTEFSFACTYWRFSQFHELNCSWIGHPLGMYRYRVGKDSMSSVCHDGWNYTTNDMCCASQWKNTTTNSFSDKIKTEDNINTVCRCVQVQIYGSLIDTLKCFDEMDYYTGIAPKVHILRISSSSIKLGIDVSSDLHTTLRYRLQINYTDILDNRHYSFITDGNNSITLHGLLAYTQYVLQVQYRLLDVLGEHYMGLWSHASTHSFCTVSSSPSSAPTTRQGMFSCAPRDIAGHNIITVYWHSLEPRLYGSAQLNYTVRTTHDTLLCSVDEHHFGCNFTYNSSYTNLMVRVYAENSYGRSPNFSQIEIPIKSSTVNYFSVKRPLIDSIQWSWSSDIRPEKFYIYEVRCYPLDTLRGRITLIRADNGINSSMRLEKAPRNIAISAVGNNVTSGLEFQNPLDSIIDTDKHPAIQQRKNTVARVVIVSLVIIILILIARCYQQLRRRKLKESDTKPEVDNLPNAEEYLYIDRYDSDSITETCSGSVDCEHGQLSESLIGATEALDSGYYSNNPVDGRKTEPTEAVRCETLDNEETTGQGSLEKDYMSVPQTTIPERSFSMGSDYQTS